MKKCLLLYLSFCFLFVSAASCQQTGIGDTPAPTKTKTQEAIQDSEPIQPTKTEEKSKTLTIGFSWARQGDDPYYIGMRDTLHAAMEAHKDEYGYETVRWIYRIAGEDAQQQKKDIQDFIDTQVDLIVVYAFDTKEMEVSLSAARKAGIPFIAYDRPIDPSVAIIPDATIALDTTTMDYQVGKALIAAMEEAGITPNSLIMIEGDYADQICLSRPMHDGFDRACQEAGIEVKQRVASEWDVNKGLDGFTAAYEANPDCNVVFVSADFIIPAVETVLKKAGKWKPNGEAGHVWVVSADLGPSGIPYIKDRYLDFAISDGLENMAEAFATTAFRLIAYGIPPVEKYIYVESEIVTKENLESCDTWAKEYERGEQG